MSLTFYMMLLIGGGNDIIGSQFNLSINAITWAIRIGIFILPPISFVITKRICLSLQRSDRYKLLHGRETGSIMRLPEGAFVEVHAPLSDNEKAVILSVAQRDGMGLVAEDFFPFEMMPPEEDAA